MTNNKNDLGYTGIGDKPSKRKNFPATVLPKKVAEIESRFIDEEVSDNLEGQGLEIIIPLNIIDIYIRLEPTRKKDMDITKT